MNGFTFGVQAPINSSAVVSVVPTAAGLVVRFATTHDSATDVVVTIPPDQLAAFSQRVGTLKAEQQMGIPPEVPEVPEVPEYVPPARK